MLSNGSQDDGHFVKSWSGVIVWMLWVLAQPLFAQTIRVDVSRMPLGEALNQFGSQQGIDLVYAERLVQGRMASCRYEGDDTEEALACMLTPHGLRAEVVRRRQYVLVAVPEMNLPTPVAPKVLRGTLQGLVKDQATGEVLPGAHIYLTDLELGAATNKGGYFTLPSLPIEAYRVRVSFLGYHPCDTVLFVNQAMAEIALKEVTLQGEEVVVEGTRDPSPVDPGVVSIPTQTLEALPIFPGESDLFQALQWLPGVQKAGEASGGLVVRGSEPDQNLYLLDGAPVYHPWHAFSLISTFQSETFKDIKLYQGAFPAEYGGRLSAVLDAEMKDGNTTEPKVQAALGLLSARMLVEGAVNKQVTFMFSGRRFYLDQLLGTRHPVSEEGVSDTLRTGYYFYDLSGKVTFRSGTRHRLSVSYYEGRDVLDVRLPFDLSFDIDSWLKPADLFFEIDQYWGNRLLSARYQYLLSRRLFLSATAYHSSYSAQEGVFIRPTDATYVLSDYGVQLRDGGLKLDVDYYASLSHQLRAGIQVVQRGFKSGLDARIQRAPGTADVLDQESRSEAVEAVAYLQDLWQPSARWQVQSGLRASFFSSGKYVHLNPRLGVRYSVDPKRLILRGAVGGQVQYLHFIRDRFSLLYDLVSGRWTPVSTQVRPSTGVQVSAGAEAYPASWLTVGLDGYWKYAWNVLMPRDAFQAKDGLEGPGIDLGALLGQYVAGPAQAYGIEVSARAEKGPWQLWLSYAGGRSLNKMPGIEEKGFHPTRYDIPRAFQGAIIWRKQGWRISLGTVWRSGVPVTVPVARYALNDPLDETPTRYLYIPAIHNGRLPPYLRFDLMVGHRFRILGARVQTQLQLYNATNRDNVVDRRYESLQEDPVRIINRIGFPLLPLLDIQLEL